MIRNDFTIDWEVSPRVIIIDAPSTECTMQDLLDTLRYEEAKAENIDNKFIVNASGKEPLGGGTKVGITVALQNAVIGFEARSSAPWITCSLSGGNLVAFGTDGISTIEPTYPTAYISISKTSSSSATLQEQDALNYSSYGGMVSVDINSENSGVAYPVGNQEYPVNNYADAIAVANNKGFTKIGIRSTSTIGGGDLSGFKLTGSSHTNVVLTVQDLADVQDVVITEVELSGILDGGTDVTMCIIRDVSYFNGHIHNCSLGGTIILGGNSESFITDCSRLENEIVPTIDFDNGNNHLVMSKYSGVVLLKNITNSLANILIGLDQGRVVLNSANVSAGTIHLSGIGDLIDENGDEIVSGTWNGVSIINNLISNESIARTTWAYER